jgi:hypothetical protein
MNTEIRLSRVTFAIGMLSAATLVFEAALVRFLAVAQFYHFAFLIVSLALLGFGASGTLLSLFPQLKNKPLPDTLARVGIWFTLSIWITYGVVNWLPFDSYSIAWERRQILFFILYYFSLSLPFLVSGLGLGTALAVIEKKHNRVYAANLVGSGMGVLLAPAVLSLSGMLGVILFSAFLGLSSWMVIKTERVKLNLTWVGCGLFSVLAVTALVYLSILNLQGRSPVGIKISPYKGLAYARLFPDAEHLFGKWQAESRVDVLANAGTRRLPGLSYLYGGALPSQYGLSVDGDALQPITMVKPADFPAAEWLPEWWAFSIQSNPKVLVLNPGAGFGLLQAAAGKAGSIQTVLEDRLILEGVQKTAPGYSMFNHPDVNVLVGNQRAFLESTAETYDLVFLPLTDSYQPVTNGAYSISENYSLTMEGIEAALDCLSPGGIFLTSRWLQNPPSEELRMVSTVLAALENMEIENPRDAFLIYRGIQTITIVVKPAGWDEAELVSLRQFLERCRFDLVWAPDLELAELNRWNQLQEPVYYQAVQQLFLAQDKVSYFQSYPYNIAPPTDNQPFFFHFFTWSQTSQILENMGKTWQPFGGSGFLLLVFLLGLVVLLSGFLILLPLMLGSKKLSGPRSPGKAWVLLYFGLIGTGFMFLEIPLISQWRLFLNSPLAAFSVVVGLLLLYSGLGSLTAEQGWSRKSSLLALFVLGGGGFILFTTLDKDLVLSWPSWIRYLAPCLGLAPTGFLMGLFFPGGISWLKESFPGLVPWAWAVNGSASVIASVATSILSLQAGYALILVLGSLAYLAAWLILRAHSD